MEKRSKGKGERQHERNPRRSRRQFPASRIGIDQNSYEEPRDFLSSKKPRLGEKQRGSSAKRAGRCKATLSSPSFHVAPSPSLHARVAHTAHKARGLRIAKRIYHSAGPLEFASSSVRRPRRASVSRSLSLSLCLSPFLSLIRWLERGIPTASPQPLLRARLQSRRLDAVDRGPSRPGAAQDGCRAPGAGHVARGHCLARYRPSGGRHGYKRSGRSQVPGRAQAILPSGASWNRARGRSSSRGSGCASSWGSWAVRY